MGNKSFENFFEELQCTHGVSLRLTKEELRERQRLEYTIQNLQEKIDAGVSKLEELHQEKMILEKREAEIAAKRILHTKLRFVNQEKLMFDLEFMSPIA